MELFIIKDEVIEELFLNKYEKQDEQFLNLIDRFTNVVTDELKQIVFEPLWTVTEYTGFDRALRIE